MREIKVKPANGKLGVMCVGLGAVTTTTIIGTLMARKGLAKPVGSFACEGIMRLGKGKEKCYKEVKDIIPIAALDDIVQRLHDLHHRRIRVEAVDLIEIDVIHVQALQGVVDLRHDVSGVGLVENEELRG